MLRWIVNKASQHFSSKFLDKSEYNYIAHGRIEAFTFKTQRIELAQKPCYRHKSRGELPTEQIYTVADPNEIQKTRGGCTELP